MNEIRLRFAITVTLVVFCKTELFAQAPGSGPGAPRGTPVGTASGVTTDSQPGTATSRAAAPNTVGAAGINQPAANPPVGGANVITTPPNTVGGATVVAPSPVAPAAPTAVFPGAQPIDQAAVPLNALPLPVQNSLQGFAARGALGSVVPMTAPNGVVIYRATVTQNGVPVELRIAANGQILARAPSVAGAVAAPGVIAAQAGLPINALPAAVQNSLRSQLGPNAEIQTVSRDDLANGTVFRITALQNGQPTEFRFAANGTLLSTTPILGAATSFFTPGTAVIPSAGVLFESLPMHLRSVIREQTGNGRIGQIAQQPGPNGLNYLVTYDQNGRPMRMLVSADGRVLRNEPLADAAAGTPPSGASGTGAGGTSTNRPVNTNSPPRTSSVSIEDLPGAVRDALEREATPYAQVRYITREERLGTDVYTVGIRSDTQAGTLVLDVNGRVLEDTRREIGDLTIPKPAKAEQTVTGIPFNNVPMAIQNAIKAYAAASDIRSITLGRENEKTVYDVIFLRDGRRDRLFIAKNGDLVRVEHNVPPWLELKGFPEKSPALAISDLPRQVQDTVRRQTDNALVKEIKSTLQGDEPVYEVNYETNGRPRRLFVGRDGAVVIPKASVGAESGAQPLPAPVPAPGEELVREIEAAGKAGEAERGAAESEPAPAQIRLKDAPKHVQDTVKKIAGSATVESITPSLGPAGMVYKITFLEEGATRRVMIDKNGVVQTGPAAGSDSSKRTR